MSDAIATVLNNGGLVVLIGVGIVYAIVRGWILPRSFVDRLIAAHKQQLDDANERAKFWRDAYDNEHRVSDALIGQNHQLLAIGDTTQRVVQALQPAPGSNSVTPSAVPTVTAGGGSGSANPLA